MIAMAEYEIEYSAELRCYWCGHQVGAVTSKSPVNQPGAPIAFSPREGEPKMVRSLGEVRCSRCRGPVFAEGLEKRRIYANFVFRQRRPRRPKVA